MGEFKWPDERICAVALTFDLDGETIPYMLDPPQATKRLALMSEFSYGPNVAMPHILDLLDLYEIKASFFSPARTLELHPDIAREIVARGHDLGHHGFMHERPDGLSDEKEERVLKAGIDVIEGITGGRPIGYRSPAWELKPSSPALLKRHGFQFDSSLMGYDIPYWVETAEGDLLELPVSWRNDDWPQFGFVSVPPVGNGINPPSIGLEVFTAEFEGLFARGGLFNMTMHPFLAGRPSGMIVLERLIRHLRGFPRVWWAKLSEISEYCHIGEVAPTLPRASTKIPAAKWID
ncbi:MAG: polysaccharide deacetylase [Chloroflexi bacterium]|nr:polysaccharide deacetylase [Chloroflexota bacterium]